MKRIIMVLMAALLAFAPIVHAGDAGKIHSPGPAPNSGDGIPDGSGFDEEAYILESLGISSSGPGKAPNAGDGIPDGSGWDVPPQGKK